jgi:hypothetical protein
LAVERISSRDARAEAESHAEKLRGPGCSVQILEPAPPAVNDPPWFADHEPVGDRIVSPYGPIEWRWSVLADVDETLRDWCAERWLGPYRRLQPLPGAFQGTRVALHQLAESVISPARKQANTKIGLRWTLGGFGTPFFGADVQVRVEGGRLVVQEGGEARSAPISTLAAARELLGALAAPVDTPAPQSPLEVDADAALALGDLYGFATSVLEELRYDAAPSLEASRTQLWPEHFDVSVELGGEAAGTRAGYGVSPGDEQHAEPYLYVVPWGEVPTGPNWQASGFNGAELTYAALLNAPDQREAALDFFRACQHDLLG